MQCHECSKPFLLQWLVLLHPWAIDHSELFLYCKCVSWSLLHALHKHPGSLFSSWSLHKVLLSWLNSLPQQLSLLLAKPSQHKNEDVSNSTNAIFPTRGRELWWTLSASLFTLEVSGIPASCLRVTLSKLSWLARAELILHCQTYWLCFESTKKSKFQLFQEFQHVKLSASGSPGWASWRSVAASQKFITIWRKIHLHSGI